MRMHATRHMCVPIGTVYMRGALQSSIGIMYMYGALQSSSLRERVGRETLTPFLRFSLTFGGLVGSTRKLTFTVLVAVEPRRSEKTLAGQGDGPLRAGASA